MPASMSGWDSQVVKRFKTLLNVGDSTGGTSEEGAEGDSEEAKLERAAIARDRNPGDAQAAHQVLTALAFSGYRDWCGYDDDDWIRNCLGQVLDADQSAFLASALQGAGLVDLTTAVQMMAGPYATAWQQAAQADAPPTGLTPYENAESWEYSRTPGTRYYIFHDGQYLYSDDKDAPLAGWATAEIRDEAAAQRAVEWQAGSGVYFTSYDNPAHVGNATHVFGRGSNGPWNLTQEQAADLLAQSPQSQAGGVTGEGSPIQPYHDTGHYTKYENGTYYFGETADTATWYPTYQELLNAITTPAEPPEGGAEAHISDEQRQALEALFDAVPGASSLTPEQLSEVIARASEASGTPT